MDSHRTGAALLAQARKEIDVGIATLTRLASTVRHAEGLRGLYMRTVRELKALPVTVHGRCRHCGEPLTKILDEFLGCECTFDDGGPRAEPDHIGSEDLQHEEDEDYRYKEDSREDHTAELEWCYECSSGGCDCRYDCTNGGCDCC